MEKAVAKEETLSKKGRAACAVTVAYDTSVEKAKKKMDMVGADIAVLTDRSGVGVYGVITRDTVASPEARACDVAVPVEVFSREDMARQVSTLVSWPIIVIGELMRPVSMYIGGVRVELC